MARLSTQQVLKDNKSGNRNTISSLSFTHKALSDLSCLGQFKNLERLDLASNNLTSLQGVGSCVSLKWLSVVQNKLQSLKGIEALCNLTVLNAGKNKLKSMDEVVSTVSLRALILNDNEIVSICRLDQLKELNTLVLSRNLIREIGESLVKVKSITKLSLSNCQLQAIDSSLKSCIELKELRLAHNEIKTLPAELAYNKKLQNLDLGNNVIMRWSDLKVLNALFDLKILNLRGNPIADSYGSDKLAKKIQKLLPKLHVFNSRSIVKGTRNGNGGEVSGAALIPANHPEVHKKGTRDLMRDKKSSEHEMDQSESTSLDGAKDLDMEKDLMQKRRKIMSMLPKKEDITVYQNDDAMVETKLKRKKSQEEKHSADDLMMEKYLKQKRNKTKEKLSGKEVPASRDGSTTVEKKPKSEKSRKGQGELDVIDNAEAPFADLFVVSATESSKHGDRKKIVDKANEDAHALGGLVAISAKKNKKRYKNQGADPTIELSMAVEVGMGGPSTWGDE